MKKKGEGTDRGGGTKEGMQEERQGKESKSVRQRKRHTRIHTSTQTHIHTKRKRLGADRERQRNDSLFLFPSAIFLDKELFHLFFVPSPIYIYLRVVQRASEHDSNILGTRGSELLQVGHSSASPQHLYHPVVICVGSRKLKSTHQQSIPRAKYITTAKDTQKKTYHQETLRKIQTSKTMYTLVEFMLEKCFREGWTTARHQHCDQERQQMSAN